MLTNLLARLGLGSKGVGRDGNGDPADNSPGSLLPYGWGMRGSLRGAPSNADTRVIVDYRRPSPISVGTLQAIETMYGRTQLVSPQTRIGAVTPVNGNRWMGYSDSGQRFVGSSLLLTAGNGPALNRRAGLPATGPIAGQPLSPMSSLLLQSDSYDMSAGSLLDNGFVTL